jgi:hypothetical protein
MAQQLLLASIRLYKKDARGHLSAIEELVERIQLQSSPRHVWMQGRIP